MGDTITAAGTVPAPSKIYAGGGGVQHTSGELLKITPPPPQKLNLRSQGEGTVLEPHKVADATGQLLKVVAVHRKAHQLRHVADGIGQPRQVVGN